MVAGRVLASLRTSVFGDGDVGDAGDVGVGRNGWRHEPTWIKCPREFSPKALDVSSL
jgi:hypothetical protein